jgi:hypothetical protein
MWFLILHPQPCRGDLLVIVVEKISDMVIDHEPRLQNRQGTAY